ncbi:hypothetical protein [Streptomyces sp. NPDC015130]|uniref:hypothetical protein n=1 Tax=Streptomyces sp. NPDC015130 TaxID=3364940 RepID=UPI0036FFAA29
MVTLSTYSPDPSLFFRSQFDTRVPDGQGLGAFDDPAPHRAIDRAMAATGGAQEEAWAAVDTLLVTRGVVVPICWYESLLPYHRDLEGLTHLDGLGPSLAAAYVKS